MTTATVTFTNSDISNAIVLTVVNANSPIIDVTIDSGNPYTTQALDLNKNYLLQLHKQGVVKSFFLTVTSNPFGCDLNDLFNGTTPTPAKVTFINSDTSNAITLSVRDDQGNTVVDDVSVTSSDPYVIDTLKLDATYSVHLEREGASKQDISLPITSSPFTYDVYTPFLNDAIVVFTNSDKSRSIITLSVLDDEGVPVVSDVVVSPGSNPYITTLQLKETYKILLVKGTAQTESSMAISSDPFLYDVNTPFYAQVTFTNSDQSNAISLSVPDGKGGYLIQDVSVTNSQPYVTEVLDLNQTYTLRSTKGTESALLSLEINYNRYIFNTNSSYEAPVNVTFTNTNVYTTVSLSVLDGRGGYHIKDALIRSTQPYATRFLNLNAAYSLELRVIGYGVSAQSSITINSNSFTYDVHTPFFAEVTFFSSHTVSYFDVWDSNIRQIIDNAMSYPLPYTVNYLILNATYTLDIRMFGSPETRRTSMTVTASRLDYDLNAAF